MDTLGKRIALHRHMRQYTQERLAGEVGITQSTLSDVENDKISPTWKLISDIAKALDVHVLKLVLNNHNGQGAPAGDNIPGKGADRELATLTQLLQTKDELIKAKDELIRELRGKDKKKEAAVPISRRIPKRTRGAK